MRKRLIIIGFVCFLVICASYIWLSLNPIIIHKPYPQNAFGTSFDDSYNPINSMDFTHGENKIVIYIDWKDVQFLPAKTKRWTLLECRDNCIIEAVKIILYLKELVRILPRQRITVAEYFSFKTTH